MDGQRYFGLYLAQLQERVKGLKALTEPVIGDSLVRSDDPNAFWLQGMVAKGGKLDMGDTKQLAGDAAVELPAV